MAHVSDLIASDIEQYLKSHEHKSLLRFITCGSVDDGKSTLIGRLLYESKMLFEDQLAAIEADSKKWGTQGGEIDFALLVDGLAAEREQGITIDVAYRFFSTDRRKFIVADTPGHEQYTRNMVTGASTADVAVILIDARRGVLTQSRRHSYLVSLIGIRHVVLAINKMDLMNYSQEVYDKIVAEYSEFAAQIGLKDVTPIPMSALKGDNIVDPSESMPWYSGPTLMSYLESVEIDEARMQKGAFRLPVQWVNRPNLDFRGFAGTIASGVVRTGDRVKVLPSGKESTVARIVTFSGDLEEAIAGQSVTLTLADEIDISRGDVLAKVSELPQVDSAFEATVVWMHDTALQPGRPYLLKTSARTATATIDRIEYQVNVNTLERTQPEVLELNGIAVCSMTLDRSIAFDPYEDNKETGGFILIDRLSNTTVGAGLLLKGLQGEQKIGNDGPLDQKARAAHLGQKPVILWVSGGDADQRLSIGSALEKKLLSVGMHTYLLAPSVLANAMGPCGDYAQTLNQQAGVAALMADAGLVVIVVAADGAAIEHAALVASLQGQGVLLSLDGAEAGAIAVDVNAASEDETIMALLQSLQTTGAI
ncbi:sulfate adenylyltransferase subunit CysN [Leeia sp. TBRC 13508]|uniref:Sulfate adenylyltransferase subunit 1 n=1 Tax=Leeia speluncae TaxID=2884804 RepID=A0ABS8D318_9NEIS|nr:sulfate adenylyltransferase subunit CysN [Leeia speluncae]MCB6182596.1 sulfate adenylyltransferase subunit CysN [Leeia speluncae]